MIRQLKDGKCRLYSRKTDEKTGKRRNLGAFETCEAAEKHEREVQYSSGIEGGLFGAYLWRPRWRHAASLRDRFTLNSAKAHGSFASHAVIRADLALVWT